MVEQSTRLRRESLFADYPGLRGCDMMPRQITNLVDNPYVSHFGVSRTLRQG